MPITPQYNIPLALLTTIRLGGSAKEYVSCASNEDIVSALSYAKEKNLHVHILGGGSNTIFQDNGFDGLVIHIQTKGITTKDTDGNVLLTAQAGEDWDTVVQYAVLHNLTGIECLSGIPGSCGGTPFQNVGAYGQDVSQTIVYVDAIDRTTLQPIRFSNQECMFAYRTSRFKEGDQNQYVITSVTFRLTPNSAPVIRYVELQTALSESPASLANVRTAVLKLRKKKSMLIDPQDPNSISCGSFFTNPIIPASHLQEIQKTISEPIPSYDAGVDTTGEQLQKLSAAWLVEHAGFAKGAVHDNVGISQNHSLALINRGGTTEELLAYAQTIQTAVKDTFGITLALEPLVIS